MSGVWVFKNGVVRLVDGGEPSNGKKKVLVHVPSDQVITSYEMLETKLAELGWERYRSDSQFLQFHKHSSVHLISVPTDFSKLKSVHMYDIVVKSRNIFEVREA
ncbi:putative flowering-promoting factor 1 [Dioscorea sansibarensis]